MNKKIAILVSVLMLVSLVVIGCTNNEDEDTGAVDNSDLEGVELELESLKEEKEELKEEIQNLNLEIEDLKEENEELSQGSMVNIPDPNMTPIQLSLEIMELIKDNQMDELAAYVHPDKGLRFSPYFYIDEVNDQVFIPGQVAGLNQDTNLYTWGSFDGTGDPIEMNFQDYYDRFIYDADYYYPHIIGNNTAIQVGNMLDNVEDIYPNGEYIEFHFTGFDPQYEGLDWSSLRLIFEEHLGVWHLVGISHGEWTI